jgi:CRP-like cAMP-binding protein
MQPGCGVCILNDAPDRSVEVNCLLISKDILPKGQRERLAAARRLVCRGDDLRDNVVVVCAGWAALVATLSDSRRQILGFLLPGDMASMPSFDEPPHYLVEAITDVQYHLAPRDTLTAAECRDGQMSGRIEALRMRDKMRSDHLIVDLGRRSAEERIARLILNLAARLNERGALKHSPLEMEFPLRQHHIADATGLTQVHVGKVLSRFRRDGIVLIGGRTLTVADEAQLRRAADMQ